MYVKECPDYFGAPKFGFTYYIIIHADNKYSHSGCHLDHHVGHTELLK